jgi:hypothetical protein
MFAWVIIAERNPNSAEMRAHLSKSVRAAVRTSDDLAGLKTG